MLPPLLPALQSNNIYAILVRITTAKFHFTILVFGLFSLIWVEVLLGQTSFSHSPKHRVKKITRCPNHTYWMINMDGQVWWVDRQIDRWMDGRHPSWKSPVTGTVFLCICPTNIYCALIIHLYMWASHCSRPLGFISEQSTNRLCFHGTYSLSGGDLQTKTLKTKSFCSMSKSDYYGNKASKTGQRGVVFE